LFPGGHNRTTEGFEKKTHVSAFQAVKLSILLAWLQKCNGIKMMLSSYFGSSYIAAILLLEIVIKNS